MDHIKITLSQDHNSNEKPLELFRSKSRCRQRFHFNRRSYQGQHTNSSTIPRRKWSYETRPSTARSAEEGATTPTTTTTAISNMVNAAKVNGVMSPRRRSVRKIFSKWGRSHSAEPDPDKLSNDSADSRRRMYVENQRFLKPHDSFDDCGGSLSASQTPSRKVSSNSIWSQMSPSHSFQRLAGIGGSGENGGQRSPVVPPSPQSASGENQSNRVSYVDSVCRFMENVCNKLHNGGARNGGGVRTKMTATQTTVTKRRSAGVQVKTSKTAGVECGCTCNKCCCVGSSTKKGNKC